MFSIGWCLWTWSQSLLFHFSPRFFAYARFLSLFLVFIWFAFLLLGLILFCPDFLLFVALSWVLCYPGVAVVVSMFPSCLGFLSIALFPFRLWFLFIPGCFNQHPGLVVLCVGLCAPRLFICAILLLRPGVFLLVCERFLSV